MDRLEIMNKISIPPWSYSNSDEEYLYLGDKRDFNPTMVLF